MTVDGNFGIIKLYSILLGNFRSLKMLLHDTLLSGNSCCLPRVTFYSETIFDTVSRCMHYPINVFARNKVS